MTYPLRTLIPALALLTTSVTAFWRLECDGNVGLGRLDPLMAFNAASDHVHSIKGGSGNSSRVNGASRTVILTLCASLLSHIDCRRFVEIEMYQLRCQR